MRLLLFCCASLVLSCSQGNQDSTQVITLLSCSEFEAKAAEDGLLLDVRTAEEFAEGHIKGAVNIDVMENDFESRIVELDIKKMVLVYCRSGSRSAKAAKIIRKAGVKKIFDLEGGITFWVEEGYTIEQ